MTTVSDTLTVVNAAFELIKTVAPGLLAFVGSHDTDAETIAAAREHLTLLQGEQVAADAEDLARRERGES